MWCPPGATWTYNYALFNERGTVTVRYVRDTVAAGQPAQLLTRRINSCYYVGPNACLPGTPYNLTPVLTRTVGDRVEVQAYGQFYTLYDFAAPVGSTWLTPMVIPLGPCPQTHGLGTVRVDSVGTQRVGGQTLRWFRARLTAPAGASYQGFWPGRIYEQLGNVLTYMQPQSPACPATDPGFMGGMVEYRATGQPTVTIQSGALLLHTAEGRAGAAGFAAFPNPGAGQLTLQLPANLSPGATLRLLDLSGRTLRAEPAGRQLDLDGLPAGVYTLLLEQPGHPALARRLVRE
jgi:hypothetical protein